MHCITPVDWMVMVVFCNVSAESSVIVSAHSSCSVCQGDTRHGTNFAVLQPIQHFLGPLRFIAVGDSTLVGAVFNIIIV
jgi:hypothetical protein